MKTKALPKALSVMALAVLCGCATNVTSSLNSVFSSASGAASSTGAGSSSMAPSSVASSSEESTDVPSGYRLDWSDEFDGDGLDSDYWTPLIGNGAGGWGNNEAEYYTRDNATVADGLLTITAKADTTYSGFSYTSARLVTARKESTTYGYIEARISLPAVNGMWPDFWMLPENGSWPTAGEIDIMENRGSSPWTTSGALHYANANGHTYNVQTHSFSKRNGEENITGWHTYGLEWTEDEISWFVDGKDFFDVPKRTWHPDNGTVYTGDDSAPFDAPFHILLNLAIGGNFDNGTLPPADFASCAMKVDYVRVYDAV
jgi:beta-glucanase (GH16 family)